MLLQKGHRRLRALWPFENRLTLAVRVAELCVPQACRTYVEKCFELVVEVVVVVEAAHRNRDNFFQTYFWTDSFWRWLSYAALSLPAKCQREL